MRSITFTFIFFHSTGYLKRATSLRYISYNSRGRNSFRTRSHTQNTTMTYHTGEAKVRLVYKFTHSSKQIHRNNI